MGTSAVTTQESYLHRDSDSIFIIGVQPIFLVRPTVVSNVWGSALHATRPVLIYPFNVMLVLLLSLVYNCADMIAILFSPTLPEYSCPSPSPSLVSSVSSEGWRFNFGGGGWNGWREFDIDWSDEEDGDPWDMSSDDEDEGYSEEW